ncbi:uncharacterized protein LOC117647899 [Thrips palmi]|uniref:Uncharacterized protein LOC117647899 n=1 Tax=Thrips palmi TaxID=161013 RepID=A0A6P8Z6D9_THRPL|nr:uncharacterized protein LOC117647899 [Thrips palmi]
MASTSEEGIDIQLIQSISTDIQRIIQVTPQKAKEVAEHLYDLKLRRLDHLAYVKETDLGDLLSPFEARQLLEVWKGGEGSSGGQDKENRRPRVIVEGTTDDDKDKFRINWQDIYAINKDIKKKMIQGKKLKRREKKQIIGRIVQQVRDQVPNASRDVFDKVAQQLHDKHSITFQSELAKGRVVKKTLSFKMKTKFDNDRRPIRRTTTEQQAPSIKAAYGCLRWRVVDLPAGETEETLEEKRIALENYFESHRQNAWDWTYINGEMDQLFGQQRAEINRQAEEILKAQKALRRNKNKGNQNQQQVPPGQQAQVVVTTTSDLRDRWPFLFVPSGMLMHFTKLTDINLEEKFETFMDSKLEKIVDFLLATNSDKKKKSVKKNMDRAIEELGQDSTVPVFAAAMLLLIQRFKENKKALWLMVDEHVEESEISAHVELPRTPCLIIQGTTIP